MPAKFKLVKKEFSKTDDEWQWTYSCLFTLIFNEQEINKITITDYTWKKKGREMITKELILNIFKENLNSERREPTKIHKKRKVFVEERIPYGDKDYLLVFWSEDNNSDWLWVRNCYPMN